MQRLTLIIVALLAAAVPPVSGDDPLRFAVIGDNGTGDAPQYDVARQMAVQYQQSPFELVLMVGDNMYGRQEPADFVAKFERPYEPLLHAGVRFYATLGNHDRPSNREYEPFNMHGARYYTFVREDVRFVVLDTNQVEPAQIAWARDTLAAAREPWKIVYFHHPLYSSCGRHGSNVELRVLLEPVLVNAGVQVVFSGHDHHYERFTPQRGVTYFVAGGSAKLRKGNTPAPGSATIHEADYTFMVVEVAGDRLSFRTITRAGRVVDAGTIPRSQS